MTKKHHRCDDEHCEVHRELTERIKKKTKPKTKKTVKKIKPEVVNVYTSKPKSGVTDRYTKSVDDIKELVDVVKNEDSFVALQHCIKILEGIKRDHGY